MLFAIPGVYFPIRDRNTHFLDQFLGCTGSSLGSTDYLAAGHNHDESCQNDQDRKGPKDD